MDGSMFEGAWEDFRAIGFALVLVTGCGDLAAYGFGVPPSWCRTAAAAEAWALYEALAQEPFAPRLRTDCQSLLATAREGEVQAIAASRPLARVWRLIANTLDGDLESLVSSGRLVWMPAHQQLSAIDSKSLSNGKLLTGVDWRANRLVDALAKVAAASRRAPLAVRRLLESAVAAVKHSAALLGVVTHAANNHKAPFQRPDGSWSSRTLRDAQQPVQQVRKRRREPKPPPEPAPLPTASRVDLLHFDLSLAEPRPKRRRTAYAKALAGRRRMEEEQTSRRVSEIGARLVASSEPPAQQLLTDMRQRVRARLQGLST
jgi:hypothetical protein